MRLFYFLVLSGLALPAFAVNMLNDPCCPTCPRWEHWGLTDYNKVIYHPDELPQKNLLDCVLIQQRFVGV